MASPAGAHAIPTVEERVSHIVGMMERFEWDRGKSAPVLANLWGLAVATVEKNSAEAHRRCTADKDEAEREISLGARKLYRDAVNAGDAKAAKLMGDLWADVSGARAPERKDITGKIAAVGLDELDDLRRGAKSNECPKDPDSEDVPED